MGELLLDAAKARTESIKLGNVPYAKELSDQLLEHASKLEGLYKSTEKAMQSNASEKDFKSLMAEIGEATAFTAKAKAWALNANVWGTGDNDMYIYSYKCYVPLKGYDVCRVESDGIGVYVKAIQNTWGEGGIRYKYLHLQ